LLNDDGYVASSYSIHNVEELRVRREDRIAVTGKGRILSSIGKTRNKLLLFFFLCTVDESLGNNIPEGVLISLRVGLKSKELL